MGSWTCPLWLEIETSKNSKTKANRRRCGEGVALERRSVNEKLRSGWRGGPDRNARNLENGKGRRRCVAQ